MNTLLKVEDLKIYYGSIEALKGISLTVAEGEIVTVLGANGAGKSTLLRAISGLLPIRSGKIKLDDQELNNVKAFKIVWGSSIIKVKSSRNICLSKSSTVLSLAHTSLANFTSPLK